MDKKMDKSESKGDDITSVSNYLHATAHEEVPKMKFSELQNWIKKSQYMKKIRENFYEIPELWNELLNIPQRILNHIDMKEKDSYYDRIHILQYLIRDMEELLQHPNSEYMRSEYVNSMGEIETNRERVEKCRRYWCEMLHHVKNRGINIYNIANDEKQQIENDAIDNQLLDNHLYPFYHISNHNHTLYNYDPISRIMNTAEKVVSLKRS